MSPPSGRVIGQSLAMHGSDREVHREQPGEEHQLARQPHDRPDADDVRPRQQNAPGSSRSSTPCWSRSPPHYVPPERVRRSGVTRVAHRLRRCRNRARPRATRRYDAPHERARDGHRHRAAVQQFRRGSGAGAYRCRPPSGSGFPASTWLECATSAELVEQMDIGGLDLAILDGEGSARPAAWDSPASSSTR